MGKEIIRVKMADLKVTSTPNILVTYGLGSCVGITVYDFRLKIGGLAHVMLPQAGTLRNNRNPAKFADTAIKFLIDKLTEMGSNGVGLEAKIFGGAQMFCFSESPELLKIGERNVAAVRELLKASQVRIVAEDIGGSCGRSIEFDTETGVVKVTSVNRAPKEF